MIKVKDEILYGKNENKKTKSLGWERAAVASSVVCGLDGKWDPSTSKSNLDCNIGELKMKKMKKQQPNSCVSFTIRGGLQWPLQLSLNLGAAVQTMGEQLKKIKMGKNGQRKAKPHHCCLPYLIHGVRKQLLNVCRLGVTDQNLL